MSELLPCPFCGAKAEEVTFLDSRENYVTYIQCIDCYGRTDIREYKLDAINRWNKRATKENNHG